MGELLLLLILVAIVVYGYRRIPGAVRDFGKARRIFKSEMQAMRDDVPVPRKRVIVAEPEDVVDRERERPDAG